MLALRNAGSPLHESVFQDMGTGISGHYDYDIFELSKIGEEDITLEQFKAGKEQEKLDNARDAVRVAVTDLKHDDKIAVLRAVLSDLVEQAELAA
jgi:hypothetical protein